jgi:hypothetical protein
MNFEIIKNKFLLLLVFMLLISSSTKAQTVNDKSFYGGLFYLTNYLASEEYIQFARTHNDLEAVDHIYEKTLAFFDEDASETFFCLTFVFIPYNHITVKLPLIGTNVRFPLPSPPQSVFNEKVKNTPKHLFFDSPNNNFGDKDKLAHFFANAFLRYNVSVFNLSEFLGIFVEYFEQGFFLQGSFDKRDLTANHLGELFAVMVQNNPNAKPSEALKVYQLLYLRIYP